MTFWVCLLYLLEKQTQKRLTREEKVAFCGLQCQQTWENSPDIASGSTITRVGQVIWTVSNEPGSPRKRH